MEGATRTILQNDGSYTTYEVYTVRSRRNRHDHIYCGIAFDVFVKPTKPIELEINSIWVRGYLGDINIWYCRGSHNDNLGRAGENWVNVYRGNKEPSLQEEKEIVLDRKIRMVPGTTTGIYIHSSRNDERGIVYDDQRSDISHEDKFIRVLPGTAHTVPEPFQNEEFGFWACKNLCVASLLKIDFQGRPNREFVGRISYGIRWILWRPLNNIHNQFPESFKKSIWTILTLAEIPETRWSALPKPAVYYLLNMLPYSWFMQEGEERSRDIEEYEEEISWRTVDYMERISNHRRHLLAQTAEHVEGPV